MMDDQPKVSPLLSHCPPTLPSRAYYDADWFERERQAIWARNWLYAGRVDAFAPGTIRRLALAGASVIVACDPQGGLSAFHNTCRHRGAEICPQDRIAYNGRLIRCPYHAWAYDGRGRLVSTGLGTPTADFDPAAHGLFPVALTEWNGFVFLCLADDPPAFRPDPGTGSLEAWPMADLVVGHAYDRTLACNWKIFWENYNECLHCPGIHPALSDRVPVYRRGIMSESEAPDWQPGTPPGPALKPGAHSWTVSGQPCGPEFVGLTEAQRAAGHFFVTLYPTMFVVAHVDYVRAVSLVPVGPETTRLRAEWLFLPETLAAPGFDLADVVDFATGVLEEDGAACEMNQRGLRSPRYDRGRLMPQEFDIHAFHNWVLAQLDAGSGR